MEGLAAFAASSENFGFLAHGEHLVLAADGAFAEFYAYSDPDASLMKARRFAETIARKVDATMTGDTARVTFANRVTRLAQAGHIPPAIRDRFDQVRQPGNQASHAHGVTTDQAIAALRASHDLGRWYYELATGVAHAASFKMPAASLGASEALNAVQTKVTSLEAAMVDLLAMLEANITAASLGSAAQRNQAVAEGYRAAASMPSQFGPGSDIERILWDNGWAVILDPEAEVNPDLAEARQAGDGRWLLHYRASLIGEVKSIASVAQMTPLGATGTAVRRQTPLYYEVSPAEIRWIYGLDPSSRFERLLSFHTPEQANRIATASTYSALPTNARQSNVSVSSKATGGSISIAAGNNVTGVQNLTTQSGTGFGGSR
jgi:Domain of unknown function (DUF4145)